MEKMKSLANQLRDQMLKPGDKTTIAVKAGQSGEKSNKSNKKTNKIEDASILKA
jgi:hypothetical protein